MTNLQIAIKERLAVIETILKRVDTKVDTLCKSNGEQNQKLVSLQVKQKTQWGLISGILLAILGLAFKVIFLR